MARYTKLVLVSELNNNKFYELTENTSSGSIDVAYGRVDSSCTKITKPLSQWDSIVKSKVKKGYKDVTHLVSVTEDIKIDENKKTTKELADIKEAAVAKFISTMKAYTDGLVSKTYSVKAVSVSQVQIDEAQSILNDLLKIDAKDETQFNTKLLELYMVIPRAMSISAGVKSYLLPNIDADKVLQQEQDNLDAMASQVSLIKNDNTVSDDVEEVEQPDKTILDSLGITMKEIDPNKDIQYLLDQIKNGSNTYGYSSRNNIKVNAIFEVNKKIEDIRFNKWVEKRKNKDTRILIHGTRCTSVIPILEQGLKIRPLGNYSFSGKIYGDGNYFSEVVHKSLGYVGNDNDKILLVYEVHTGNPFIYAGRYNGNSFTLAYKELNDRGFDSTYVKAGNGLLNSEIITYREEQCRIKYIIHLK